MGITNVGVLTFFLVFIVGGHGQELSLEISTDEPRAIGDDVTFHCQVDDFPAGGAVNWWKKQGDEEVHIGQNAELITQVERYSLETKQANSAVLFYLNIRGIYPEDNGDFGCSLSTEPEQKIYRNLVVSDPVQEVSFYQIDPESNEKIHQFQDGEELFFHEEKSYYFMCVASGSNPKPEMHITIGYEDAVTSLDGLFNRSDALLSDPTSGEVAFRRTNYEGTMTSFEALVVDWRANSQMLGCSASVPNMDAPKSVYITPVLKISPIIECPDSVRVPIWTPDVSFECNVYADPALQDIRWYWGNEHRATSLTPGEYIGSFSFDLLKGDKPDMKIARFTIRRVFIQDYVTYHLSAKNLKGLSTHSVKLVKVPTPEKEKQISIASTVSTHFVLFIALFLLQLLLSL